MYKSSFKKLESFYRVNLKDYGTEQVYINWLLDLVSRDTRHSIWLVEI